MYVPNTRKGRHVCTYNIDTNHRRLLALPSSPFTHARRGCVTTVSLRSQAPKQKILKGVEDARSTPASRGVLHQPRRDEQGRRGSLRLRRRSSSNTGEKES